MLTFLDKIPYPAIGVFTVILLLAPLTPMPHVAEKILMLKNGTLTRPLDIFDLFFHLIPLALLLLKLIRDYKPA